MNERKFIPRPVNVGLRYIEVEILFPFLVRRMSRKGSFLSVSCSTVKLMLLCLLFR